MLWLGKNEIFTFRSTYYRRLIIHLHICTVFVKTYFFGCGFHFIDLVHTSETTSVQGLHFIILCFFVYFFLLDIDFNVANQTFRYCVYVLKSSFPLVLTRFMFTQSIQNYFCEQKMSNHLSIMNVLLLIFLVNLHILHKHNLLLLLSVWIFYYYISGQNNSDSFLFAMQYFK